MSRHWIRMPKVITYDIEATGLKADFAFLLCAAFCDVDTAKTKLLSLSQYGKDNILGNEEKLVKDVAAEFNNADVLVSYYGKGFDRKFLNAKMLEYSLPPLPNIPEVDLYYTAKSNLALSRKSLQNVAYYIKAENSKTPVEGRLWKAAQTGNLRALRAIEKHNIADVEVLRDVYLKLRPLVRQQPRLGGADINACPAGHSVENGGKAQKRGIMYTTLQKPKQRLQCITRSESGDVCGAWYSIPLED